MAREVPTGTVLAVAAADDLEDGTVIAVEDVEPDDVALDDDALDDAAAVPRRGRVAGAAGVERSAATASPNLTSETLPMSKVSVRSPTCIRMVRVFPPR